MRPKTQGIKNCKNTHNRLDITIIQTSEWVTSSLWKHRIHLKALIAFKADDKSAPPFNELETLFARAPILKRIRYKIRWCHYTFKKTFQFFELPDYISFSAVAFPDAKSKTICRESRNVNCLPLELLAFTIRKYWASLRETQSACLPELPSIINLICFSSLSASSTCYESFVDLQYNERGRERVLDNQEWLWLVSAEKEMQSALSDGLLSISFTEWANEVAQHKDLKEVKWKRCGGKRTTKGEQRRGWAEGGGRRWYLH